MSTKVIAEIGINHRGKTEIAERLIKIAAMSGAWGVKFQYRDITTFYAKTDEIGDEILSQEITRVDFSAAEYQHLKTIARSYGLAVGISFFRINDVIHYGEDASDYDFLKIPSAELENNDLFEKLLEFGKPVILSTGGHSQESVFLRLEQLAGFDVIVLHCIANYPLLLGNQNLSFMQRMLAQSDLPIGYSSHDEDWEVCVIAATLGAQYIERHLTLDKLGGGLDDSTSSDPEEFSRLCEIVNHVEQVKGSGQRVVNQGEIINMQNLGSSLYALIDAPKGQVMNVSDFTLKAPRKGLTLTEFKQIRHLPLSETIQKGEPLAYKHFQQQKIRVDQLDISNCKDNQLCVPIRLHDAETIISHIPIENYEFHLSYGEVDTIRLDMGRLLKLCNPNSVYSIHLPDYLYGNRLLDPISNNTTIKQHTRELISQVSRIAEELSVLTGKEVPVVGSFSILHDDNHETTIDNIFNYIAEVETPYFKILPQWLPKIAWYFGGSKKLNLFCQQADVDYIVRNQALICLDVAHLILSANYAKVDWHEWYTILAPLANHLHVSDASGIDGEGVKFGCGELDHLEQILQHPKRKVLEVWQGHLTDGLGFIEAIKFIREFNDKNINNRNYRSRRSLSS